MGYRDRLLRDAEIFMQHDKRPVMRSVIVAHDGWCKLLNGTGGCNCNPEIRYDKTGLPKDDV